MITDVRACSASDPAQPDETSATGRQLTTPKPWGDGHPGNIAKLAFGPVVAVLVPCGLVNGACDQVSPPRLPFAVRLGIRTASAAKAGDYWREGVIPTVHYS